MKFDIEAKTNILVNQKRWQELQSLNYNRSFVREAFNDLERIMGEKQIQI